MAQSKYFRYRAPAYRAYVQDDSVERGLKAGESIGKLLGGLGEAIKGAQKDALANKLMDQQSISEQPGAGTTTDLGIMPGGPQPSQSGNTVDPSADLSTDLPEDVSSQISTQAPPQTFANPSTGNIDPLQGQAPPPTYSGTNTDPLVASNVASAKAATALQPADSGDFNFSNLQPSGPVNRNTAGSLVHTGGMQELGLQKEMLAMRMQKQAAARQAQNDAYEQANRPIDMALKRASLAKAQQDLLNPKGPKAPPVDKNPPPIDIVNQPVDNQTQLTQYVDGLHGKGTMASLNSMVADGSKDITQVPVLDPVTNQPVIDPDTKQPKTTSASTISVPLSGKKTAQLPLAVVQNYIKQQNVLLNKQHQPLLRVPGEDQSQGSKENPYPVNNKRDAFSRASGTWVRSPNGQIAQVP